MSQLFFLPFKPVYNARGLPSGAASVTFYETGTTNKLAVYSDAGLTTPLANPVVADGIGRLPDIYMPDASVYRVRVLDRLGAQLGDDVDPYIPGTLDGLAGPPGAADNTYTTLANFKASDITRKAASLVGAVGIPDSRFYWTPGDFTGLANDLTIIKANSTALSVGAWVAQSVAGSTFRQAGTLTRLRDAQSKARERRTILDYTGGDADGVASNRTAIVNMLTDGGGYLPRQAQPYVVEAQITMPAGSYLTFEAGAKVKWTGAATVGGAFDFIFTLQQGCTFGTQTGLPGDEVEIYTSTPDRYRYPFVATAVTGVTVRGVFTRDLQHTYLRSSAGTYAGVVMDGVGANICRNIVIEGGGNTYSIPLTGDQSTAPVYLAWVDGATVSDMRFSNGNSTVQWHGGDAALSADGAVANQRKCRNIVIRNITLNDVLGAGVWGSMGEKVLVDGCIGDGCGDVMFDSEGGVDVTFDRCRGRRAGTAVFSEFFNNIRTTFIRCKGTSVNGGNVLAWYGAGGICEGTRVIDCDFGNEGTGVGAISSAQGFLRNVSISNTRATDVVVDLTYNQNQNLSIGIALRFTKAIGPTAFRAGRVYKLGTARGSLIINGTSITTDVAQAGIGMQIDQIDPATPPPTTEIKNTTISEGFATAALVTAGTSGQFNIIGGNTLGSATVLQVGTGQTLSINGTYTFGGAVVT